jgi:hypothetical protein
VLTLKEKQEAMELLEHTDPQIICSLCRFTKNCHMPVCLKDTELYKFIDDAKLEEYLQRLHKLSGSLEATKEVTNETI